MHRLGLHQLLRQCDELSVVGDQVGCPTYAQDLAKAIVAILKTLVVNDHVSGTYHFVGEVGCSWADFAEHIFKEALKRGIIEKKPKILRISTSEFPTLAKRPMQSKLDCLKFKEVFGVVPSNFKGGIHSALVVIEKHKKD